jgi:NADPH:quinone reductase-like Zn-dependent oxidoreductase
MSAVAMPPVKPGDQGTPGASPAAPAAVEFRYTQTDSFVELLHRLGGSLLVSTYQANKLLAVRASGGGLSKLVRTFDKPMGLAATGGRLALGTRKEVWFLRDAPDIYFENVGGEVFSAVLPLLNDFARVPVCGLIAHYNATELPSGPNRVPQLMLAILVKRLTFRGFIVLDFAYQYADFVRDMSGWLREGRVKYREDITDGLENAPQELIGLLKGTNFGKKIIRVSADPTQR